MRVRYEGDELPCSNDYQEWLSQVGVPQNRGWKMKPTWEAIEAICSSSGRIRCIVYQTDDRLTTLVNDGSWMREATVLLEGFQSRLIRLSAVREAGFEDVPGAQAGRVALLLRTDVDEFQLVADLGDWTNADKLRVFARDLLERISATV